MLRKVGGFTFYKQASMSLCMLIFLNSRGLKNPCCDGAVFSVCFCCISGVPVTFTTVLGMLIEYATPTQEVQVSIYIDIG